jgi:hypothetical protein
MSIISIPPMSPGAKSYIPPSQKKKNPTSRPTLAGRPRLGGDLGLGPFSAWPRDFSVLFPGFRLFSGFFLQIQLFLIRFFWFSFFQYFIFFLVTRGFFSFSFSVLYLIEKYEHF